MTTPTIATLPSLLVMVGQGRALDTASRCAPRSFQHSLGHRARQRTCGRLTRKLKTLRPEFAVSVIASVHAAKHQRERCECLSSQLPEEFFRA